MQCKQAVCQDLYFGVKCACKCLMSIVAVLWLQVCLFASALLHAMPWAPVTLGVGTTLSSVFSSGDRQPACQGCYGGLLYLPYAAKWGRCLLVAHGFRDAVPPASPQPSGLSGCFAQQHYGCGMKHAHRAYTSHGSQAGANGLSVLSWCLLDIWLPLNLHQPCPLR